MSCNTSVPKNISRCVDATLYDEIDKECRKNLENLNLSCTTKMPLLDHKKLYGCDFSIGGVPIGPLKESVTFNQPKTKIMYNNHADEGTTQQAKVLLEIGKQFAEVKEETIQQGYQRKGLEEEIERYKKQLKDSDFLLRSTQISLQGREIAQRNAEKSRDHYLGLICNAGPILDRYLALPKKHCAADRAIKKALKELRKPQGQATV